MRIGLDFWWQCHIFLFTNIHVDIVAKVIFILLDGLTYGAAMRQMCYLQALCGENVARFFKLRSQLPPLSRPVYATFLTGKTPLQTGILHNGSKRHLTAPNIFALAREHGFKTAAAAYGWILELCADLKFNLNQHRFWNRPECSIQHGIFYIDDAYPDAELFADSEYLRLRYDPDLLLVHTMGIDFAGHQYGGESPEYFQAAGRADQLLAEYCPRWLAEGHDILVCSDHGMDNAGSHYSIGASVLDVPLWLVGSDWPETAEQSQCGLAALVARQLGFDLIKF